MEELDSTIHKIIGEPTKSYFIPTLDGKVLQLPEDTMNKVKDFVEIVKQDNFKHFYIEGIKFGVVQLIQHCSDGDMNKPLNSPEFIKVQELFDKVHNEVYQLDTNEFPSFNRENTLEILDEINYFIKSKRD